MTQVEILEELKKLTISECLTIVEAILRLIHEDLRQEEGHEISLVSFAVSEPPSHLGKDNLFFALKLVQNALGDNLQMGDKVQIVGRHRQHGTQVKAIDPLGVEGAEPLQVIGRDARFHAPPPLADAFHQRRHRGLQVDQQIRRRERRSVKGEVLEYALPSMMYGLCSTAHIRGKKPIEVQ